MRYGTVDQEFAMKLATYPPEQDGPALMVNFMRYRPRADYTSSESGAPEAAAPLSGREADDLYDPSEVLNRIGASVEYLGEVVDPGADSNTDRWDRVAIARYATRKSFIDMQTRPDFASKHVHKEAGMEFTINMTATPQRGTSLAEGRIETMTFVAWPEGTAPTAQTTVGAAVLDVEGRIIGDDRRWGHLSIHTETVEAAALPDGVMVVVTAPVRSSLASTIFQWPHPSQ